MEKYIKVVNQEKGIVQITTISERWYARPTTDPTTNLPTYEFVPSVTWICEHYPKGIGFYKWLANTGWDESQAIKEAAGDKGSKIHAAVGDLLEGRTVSMEAPYPNPSSGQPEPLTLEEYNAVLSFAAWHRKVQPIIIARELVVWNDAHGYAGTVDYLCTINGTLWLIDFKSSQAVWPSHELQVSAYQHTTPEWKDAKLGILQLGYKRNKDGYKLTEVEDQFPLFLATQQIWAKETAGQAPAQKDYPVSIALAPAASPVADTAQGATPGGHDGASGRGQVVDRVREGRGRRVVGGNSGGSPVRRSQGVQVKK